MAAPTEAEIRSLLRAHGLSASVPRVAIYGWLVANKVHPTAETIYKALRPQMKSLSRTTVYNVLHAFAERGLCQTVHTEDLELRYDGECHRHAHFKCTQCGSLEDLGAIPSTLPQRLGVPTGARTQEVALIFRGLCAACAAKQA